MLVLDVDGILTDGKIWLDGEGREIKSFCVWDGVATTLARYGGIKLALISGRPSPVTLTRARELKIKDVFQVTGGKVSAWESLKAKYGFKDEEMGYMGDDLLDLPLFERAGLRITVPQAPPEVKRKAHYITKRQGGEGALREAVELILKEKGKWEEVLKIYLEKNSQ